MADRSYGAIAEGYARDIVAGKIPACLSIRLQAQRFIDELAVQEHPDFPFRFDPERARIACAFVEELPHSKGVWAKQRESIRLEPWQVWIFAQAFGWVNKSDGLRRFRIIFVVVPRKNGKSAIAAGVGLYMLCEDGEFGAEVYSGATNEKQAKEVFTPAKMMASRTPDLLEYYGIEVLAEQLWRPEDNSKFETIIGKPGDGQSPSCAIHDEYHEHDTDDQVEAMRTGMGARSQPIQLLITTSGVNLAGPCYASVQEERRKLQGIDVAPADLEARAALGLPPGPPIGDTTLFIEYGIDEGDDWRSPDALRKANPNIGVSVKEEFLLAEQRDAIAKPRRSAIFRTKHLNQWVSSRTAFFDVEAWRKCKDDRIPVRAAEALALPWLAGRRCILPIDMASRSDIAALDYLFLPLEGEASTDDPYILITRYFVPSETVLGSNTYQQWHEAGLLDVTDGAVTDGADMMAAIEEASKLFAVEHVPYDPWEMTQYALQLQKLGVPVLDYRQNTQNFSAPMKELDVLIRRGAIRHGGCPVMEWQISNVTVKDDDRKNIAPGKPKGQKQLKIDNAVAAIMGIGVAMSGEQPSAYEGRGIRRL